ncbi:gamma-glutamyl-gamma-aminobutyrate hydrolase family protein [Nocardioides piscis]|uniref:Gamma-glutamyl-gamma-aminobutyrate hydrolase family protein n=1 Tax=Nocardioides piscis TaxID=2714938 RepID=A0A6G7YHD6_9ACTN|nr:gamma-glutamyl-gamma-aminobutyrate hydrolase family protein [Nocardioides piscis]QIK76213.1 gamma-glutamyl-gamma-aminobutyrate hydrolase family protein [Nocardioides piscis]
MTPVIGLTTYREPARWGVWDTSADLLPTTYAAAIQAVGGLPVLLPPVAPYATAAAAVVDRLDGLLISGGADVNPQRYGEDPHSSTTSWRDDRDGWELALLDAADARGLPVLGVCRGMQVMAAHAGGVLDQHVPDLVNHTGHSPGGDAFGTIAVSMVPESRLASLVEPRLSVHCHHHQSVRTHPGFTPAAWSEDGLLEAMEAPGERFCFGVQWHPEMAADAGLFAALVAAARLVGGGGDRGRGGPT